FYASTIANTFENARTDIFAWLPENNDSDEVIINWMPVAGATDYELSIIQRAPETTAEAIADEQNTFTGNQMPDGWETNGDYDNRAKYCGQETPSMQLAFPGAYIISPLYEHQIKNVSFWARNRFTENLCNLDIYGLRADGSMQLVKSVTDLSNKGGEYSIDFPAGMYGVKFVYFFASTGLDCNIDDINIAFADSFSDTPVTGLDVNIKNETTAIVTGLKNDTEYIAYVTPKRGEESGLRSNELIFTLSGLSVSGVEEISGESGMASGFMLNAGTIIPTGNGSYSIFAVDGTCIARGITGAYTLPQHGLYIVSTEGKSHKICW
ncbi:MAG: hypothetical protein K2M03_08890, partial [Muribaculaceae bacterium]|nr:hypothetical protein [Muribaculaceae bacterium]